MLKIEEVNTKEDFIKLREIWNKVLVESDDNNLFLSFKWLFTWWDNFGMKNQLMILLVKDNEEVVGIAPFYIGNEKKWQIFNRKIVRFIGDGISDYAGIIAVENREKQVISAVLDYFEKNKHRWCEIVLMELKEDSSLIKYLDGNDRQYKWSNTVEVCSRCPFIEVKNSWEEYYSGISKKIRKELKWLENKLARTAGYELMINKHKVSPELLDEIFSINKARLKEKNKSGWYENEEYYRFISQILNVHENNSNISISIIKIDGKIAAYAIGYIYDNKFNYWNVSIRSEYKGFSPGKVLLYHLIREMHLKRIVAEIDLLRGQEEYKYKWATGDRVNMKRSIKKRKI